MSIIAEFTVPSREFALEHALSAAPDVIVEIERVATHREDAVMPCFWAMGASLGQFDDALRADSSVREAVELERLTEATLYRAKWARDVQELIYAYVDAGASILDAVGCERRWELRIRFDSKAQLSTFQNYCNEDDILIELVRFYRPRESGTVDRYGLNDIQRETLALALDEGYFEVPRTVTTTELADQLGISHQAVSERIRRGLATLLTETIATETEG